MKRRPRYFSRTDAGTSCYIVCSYRLRKLVRERIQPIFNQCFWFEKDIHNLNQTGNSVLKSFRNSVEVRRDTRKTRDCWVVYTGIDPMFLSAKLGEGMVELEETDELIELVRYLYIRFSFACWLNYTVEFHRVAWVFFGESRRAVISLWCKRKLRVAAEAI